MSERYVALHRPPRAIVFESEWGYSATAHEVFIEDDTPIATGILNAQGVQLYRFQDRGPVGFAAEKLTR